MKRKKSIRWNTLQITALGFLGIIFLGGLLLYLPVSNTRPIAFTDALFTSVTSVCVTGLVTVAKLRNMASLCGIAEITQVGNNMLFYLSKLDINRLGAVTKAVGTRMRLETIGRAHLTVTLSDSDNPLEIMETVIKAMSDSNVN